MMRCFLCKRRIRKIRYIPLKYPKGTVEKVPICANRHHNVKAIELANISENPLIQIYHLIMR